MKVNFFSSCFEVVRQERSLLKKLFLTDPDLLKQTEFADYERNILKSLAVENLRGQNSLKEDFASQL